LIGGLTIALGVLIAVSAPSAGASRNVAAALTARQRAQLVWQQKLDRMVARGLHPARALLAPTRAPRVPRVTAQNAKQISKDTFPPVSYSQVDTQVEPDINVDPNNTQHITAVFQQSRYEDGGSVDPGYATSQDGGAHWTRGNLPNLTTQVGGPYDRASDPAVAFGPDGSVYAITIAFDVSCPNAVGVQRSDDGGLTFNDPVFPQVDGCSAFNDKEWITVDTFLGSPHYGRVYATWDRLECGQPIQLRYSDDRGATWSSLITVSGTCTSGIGVIPLVHSNGDLTLVYESFDNGDNMVSQTSHNGGVTFDPQVQINSFQGSGPPDMRTGGLVTATIDPVTGYMYAGWQDARFRSDGTNDIVLSRSTNGGQTWGPLTVVNQDPETDGLDHLTPDVSAYGGYVHVDYYTRQKTNGTYTLKVNERYIVSSDNGTTFGGELVLGPAINLTYAAQGGGYFLGDYQGIAAYSAGAHAVWERSSKPPIQETYHQVTWSATLVN
ncbi:MAG TPA: hypothetical protein VF972_07240, partial [Actinomycetota bacterium]